ncbi:COP9 signalosome complex subunit 7 [Penicillium diatomitis]|uniref:COP9 signalosome complex subunit 7 n=1 Tax=Penicillium diatomitis TaxID=2819901 RepID=A0A9W9XN63_9EURO|nr:COP9 signalosome complex subunit 7 [Penicillium diatomitis]KAJ5496086.1 COP9 signalosome complex subunit 7 [Penicillium diatomitis]
MDQTHARALEALQPFIALATSNSATSPRFISNIITNATSAPNTYVFAELLETTTVQALGSPDTPVEYQAYLKLLEIFAWGTWQDYQETPNLPELSADQALKLRLLSLLSLAATTKPLTYQSLINALSLSTAADLEALVTTAIYANLISARLSPASNPPTVNVTSVASLRDAPPHSLPWMVTILTEWESRCGQVITGLEAEIVRVKTNAQKRHAKDQVYQEQVAGAVQRRQAQAGPGDGGSGADGRVGKSGMGRGAVRSTTMGLGRNKREADDFDEHDGFESDNGDNAFRMDIDEGAGLGRAGNRQTKRVVGRRT